MAATEMQFIAREVESLFRAHYSKLVWYAQTLLTRNAQTPDPGRAEEAVQEAFAIAWSKWEVFSPKYKQGTQNLSKEARQVFNGAVGIGKHDKMNTQSYSGFFK